AESRRNNVGERPRVVSIDEDNPIGGGVGTAANLLLLRRGGLGRMRLQQMAARYSGHRWKARQHVPQPIVQRIRFTWFRRETHRDDRSRNSTAKGPHDPTLAAH